MPVVSFKQRSGAFKSKQDGFNRRRHIWTCTRCLFQHQEKVPLCLACHSADIQHFDSKKEANRYAYLWELQKRGYIKDLTPQPVFEIFVTNPGGQLIPCAEYWADFRYTDKTGEVIIEDVKGTNNEKYLDPLFKLKRKLVEAIHGVKITIVGSS